MSILEMVFSLFPILGVGIAKFAGDDGGGDDPPEDPPDDDPPKIDPELERIKDDPVAIVEYLKHQRQQKRIANAEAKGSRLKLEAFEKEKKEREEALLLEQGKHEEVAKNAKTENEANKANFLAAAKLKDLKLEAVKQGIIDTDTIDLIGKIVKIDIEMDDNYNVTNAEEVIKEFKEMKPGFFAESDGDEDDEGNKIINPVPDNKQADLKNKIKGNLRDMKPGERIRTALGKTKSKK